MQSLQSGNIITSVYKLYAMTKLRSKLSINPSPLYVTSSCIVQIEFYKLDTSYQLPSKCIL